MPGYNLSLAWLFIFAACVLRFSSCKLYEGGKQTDCPQSVWSWNTDENQSLQVASLPFSGSEWVEGKIAALLKHVCQLSGSSCKVGAVQASGTEAPAVHRQSLYLETQPSGNRLWFNYGAADPWQQLLTLVQHRDRVADSLTSGLSFLADCLQANSAHAPGVANDACLQNARWALLSAQQLALATGVQQGTCEGQCKEWDWGRSKAGSESAPRYKFVYLVRDPRSIMYTWAAAEANSNQTLVHDLLSDTAISVTAWTTWWHFYFTHHMATLYDVLPIFYEDLIEHPELEFSKLLAFLGICLDAGALTQVLQEGPAPPAEVDFKGLAGPEGLLALNRTMYLVMPWELSQRYLGPDLALPLTFAEPHEPNYPISNANLRWVLQASFRDTQRGSLVFFFSMQSEVYFQLDSCVFKYMTDLEETAAVATRFLEREVLLTPVRVECVEPKWAVPGWLRLGLKAAHETLPLAADPEPLQYVKRGKVGACVGVIYSRWASLEEWLEYYRRMGVSGFHIYYLRGMHRRPENRFELLQAPDIEWLPTTPPVYGAHVFGQTALLNACLFRLQHAYDYIMMLDPDEILHLANFPKTPDPLYIFLQKYLPTTVAAARFRTWAYPTCCGPSNLAHLASGGSPTDTLPFYEQYTRRIPEVRAQADQGSGLGFYKMVVRPRGVHFARMFRIQRAAWGFTKSVDIDVKLAFVKHIKHFNDCPCAELESG